MLAARDPTLSLEAFVSGASADRIVELPLRDKAQPAVQSDSDSHEISSLVDSDAASDSESKSDTDKETNPEDEIYKPSYQNIE